VKETGVAKGTFVITACGDAHVRRISLALASYKKFTSNDIVVVAANHNVKIEHDQVLSCEAPRATDDVRVSRILKTNVHRILGEPPGVFCYVDTDVFAVSPQAANVFAEKKGVVTFAEDSGKTVRKFSRYATRGTTLREAIARRFGVDVDESWPMWNGGVFLFDQQSFEFLDTWHQYTVDVFDDPQWTTRDQGTLAATVWKHGLNDSETLPCEYNWLHKLKRGLRPQGDRFMTDKGRQVHLLHFPIAYGRQSSQSWRTLMSMIGDGYRDRQSARNEVLWEYHHRRLWGITMSRWSYLHVAAQVLEVDVRRIAEIGVDTGVAAFHYRRLFPEAELHLIDPWLYTEAYNDPAVTSQEMGDESCRLVHQRFDGDSKVTIHRMTSEEAAATVPGQFDIVFIDANHAYEYVKQDIQLWSPRVRNGGLLAGHDYRSRSWPGVSRAVDELLPGAVVSGKNKGDVWVHAD